MKARPNLFINTQPVQDQGAIDRIYSEMDRESGTITPRTFNARGLFNIDQTITGIIGDKLQQEFQNSEGILKSLKDIQRIGSTTTLQGIAQDTYKGVLGTASSEKMLSTLNLNLKRVEILKASFDALSTITEPAFLEDTYNHASQTVIKYGINAYANNFNLIIASYNNRLEELNSTVTMVLSDTKSTSSARSGGSDRKAAPEKTIMNLLHSAEIYVLFKAIDTLLSPNNKVVLVDIFARGTSGIIKQDSNGLPEIHSVVLFKNPSNKVLVIDPSNSESSRHLAEPYNSDIFNSIFSRYDLEIIANKQKLEIYKGGGLHARDCVDIAVKIGFGLLNTEEISVRQVMITDKPAKKIDLESMPIIQQVTNQEELNDNFSSEMENPRIRQASDSIIRGKVNHLLAVIQSQLDYIKECNPTKPGSQDIEERYYKLLASDFANNPDTYQECVKALIELSGDNAHFME